MELQFLKLQVTFLDLVPGRLYNITLWTVSGDVKSRPQDRQERLHPQPVSYINATDITSNVSSMLVIFFTFLLGPRKTCPFNVIFLLFNLMCNSSLVRLT